VIGDYWALAGVVQGSALAIFLLAAGRAAQCFGFERFERSVAIERLELSKAVERVSSYCCPVPDAYSS
jgi:hypothetical protein